MQLTVALGMQSNARQPLCSFPSMISPPFLMHWRNVSHRVSLSSSANCKATPQQQNADSLDVSATVIVNTKYRVQMETPETEDAEAARTTLRVLFVSESGVCRAPLAAAAFSAAVAAVPELQGLVECSAAACRDYNVGCEAEPSAERAAERLNWSLPQNYAARCFLPSSDLARQDLILVMDKFTAADVLREASVFDTIYLEAGYSGKVRRLGEFHPMYSKGSTRGSSDDGAGLEIDDPLYGSYGGEEEIEAVLKTACDIGECCQGLVQWLAGLQQAQSDGAAQVMLREAVAGWLEDATGMEWMKPPLLSPR